MPVLGGMAGLLALFSFVHLQPDVAGQWLAGLNFAAIEYTAGNGVMHWSQILGLSGVEKVFFILFYMGLIVAVMLVVSEEAKASLSQRIALALACATLITPRIMPYDVFLLAPGLCVLVDLVRDRSHHLGRWAGRLTATGCSLAVLMSLAGYADQRLDIAWAFFSGVILLAGYVYWPKNWLQFFTNLKTRPQNYTFDRAGDF